MAEDATASRFPSGVFVAEAGIPHQDSTRHNGRKSWRSALFSRLCLQTHMRMAARWSIAR